MWERCQEESSSASNGKKSYSHMSDDVEGQPRGRRKEEVILSHSL